MDYERLPPLRSSHQEGRVGPSGDATSGCHQEHFQPDSRTRAVGSGRVLSFGEATGGYTLEKPGGLSAQDRQWTEKARCWRGDTSGTGAWKDATDQPGAACTGDILGG